MAFLHQHYHSMLNKMINAFLQIYFCTLMFLHHILVNLNAYYLLDIQDDKIISLDIKEKY